jgi:hypothetical protein
VISQPWQSGRRGTSVFSSCSFHPLPFLTFPPLAHPSPCLLFNKQTNEQTIRRSKFTMTEDAHTTTTTTTSPQVPVGLLTCQHTPYLRQFSTTVLSCSKKPNKQKLYEVQLQDTSALYLHSHFQSAQLLSIGQDTLPPSIHKHLTNQLLPYQ